MQQVSKCIPYANAYREIYQQRLMENDSEALSESVLQAAASATKLSEFIDVWSMIGAECGDFTASEELRNNDPQHSRLMELPLKDMMKSLALETTCRQWTGSPKSFTQLLERLYQTGEIREQQLIILVLPLLMSPERFLHVATEATRTNIVPVFSCLALYNPFPHDYFSENQWNQMVLKTIFVGCDITEIVGLHQRHNPSLSETIFQYVSERHSASRSIPRAVVELCETALSETSQLQLNGIKSDLRLE